METSTSTDYLGTMDQMITPTHTKKRRFCHLTLHEILTILCVASIPLALGIYAAVSSNEQRQQAEQARQFDSEQATELRQQTLYDKYLSDMYNLDKDGYLGEDKSPWAFANAYHRSSQRLWDTIRKADILIFLQEKELIGKTIRPQKRLALSSENIIQLNKLNFDNIYLTSQTGSLNQLDLKYISFDEVSMINSRFLFVDLNEATFYRARLNHVKFDDSSLVDAIFDRTQLQEANFGNSNLKGTRFLNVDLFTAKLTQEQIEQAIFYNTRLPNGTLIKSTTTSTAMSSHQVELSSQYPSLLSTNTESLNTSTTTYVNTSTTSFITFTSDAVNETTAMTVNNSTSFLSTTTP